MQHIESKTEENVQNLTVIYSSWELFRFHASIVPQKSTWKAVFYSCESCNGDSQLGM